MPLHKFKCRACGADIERVVMHEARQVKCSCGGDSARQLGAPTYRIGRKLKFIDK